jgi:hypothetical protein
MAKSDKLGPIPWTDVVNITPWYTAYREMDDGLLKRYMFVPSDNSSIGVMTSMVSCYNLAQAQKSMDGWSGFTVLLRIGESAGQEIDRPYIEMIPIRS